MLQIGDKEPFVSRPMDGAPPATEHITEHLLDGQQRLTALWKALNDLYEDRTYFALLKPETEDAPLATSVSRWMNKSQRFPLWADDPKEQLNRGLVPMRLLDPVMGLEEIVQWCAQSTDSIEESQTTLMQVAPLQRAVREANLPFLELLLDTPAEVAIDVFIKMNTTSVQLSKFDIIVAQFEGVIGQSLHDLEGSLRAAAPTTERYLPVSDLVLRVAALREDRPPTESSFMRLSMQRLSDDWETIERGIAGAIGFLNEEHIFDRDRLPTIAVVPVLASIWSQMPQSLDRLGQARTLLRQYMWRSFFTTRYERAAATAALQDYRGLVARLIAGDTTASIPVLDDTLFPIAGVQELLRAPWPRLRSTLARAILAVSLRGGGKDFADDTLANWESLSKREYHHLFPAALLRDQAGLPESDINLALNCALVTWNTNRNISAKEPVAYLRERVERATLGEDEIQRRLGSHTIPFNELNVGGYADITDLEARSARIKLHYQSFLLSRAEAVYRAATRLCRGEEWSGLETLGKDDS